MRNKTEKIGVIGVDAGLCWLGDPCYVLHKEKPPKAIGNSWSDFCSILFSKGQAAQSWQFDYDLGHKGLGVAVSTGYGDGVYPVYAEFNEEGRVAKVWVDFMTYGEDESDE